MCIFIYFFFLGVGESNLLEIRGKATKIEARRHKIQSRINSMSFPVVNFFIRILFLGRGWLTMRGDKANNINKQFFTHFKKPFFFALYLRLLLHQRVFFSVANALSLKRFAALSMNS